MNWRQYARAAARRYGYDPDLFEAQIEQESNFNPDAVSPAGARGIAQIMPGTAKGWGVDPSDPRASLDAAAKNMAAYRKKYGSVRDALIAYNAGPGRVGKPLYDETRNYIERIMGGRKENVQPQGQLAQMQGPQPQTGPNLFEQIASLTSPSMPGISEAQRQLEETTKKNWEMMASIQRMMDQPASTQIQPSPSSGGGGGGNIPGRQGTLHELFFDPLGGWDEGTSIGAIGGHGDHIHAAADRDVILAIAREAQKRGLSVRELDPFDKVDPVHTKGSWHYRNRAADISGSQEAMMAFAQLLKKRYGLK